MDEKYLRDQLHHAAETRLSGLAPDPWMTQRVLQNAKGEEKVKKKLSLGLVLAIALILITVTALAITGLREVGLLIAQTEQEEGYWGAWSTEKKSR